MVAKLDQRYFQSFEWLKDRNDELNMEDIVELCTKFGIPLTGMLGDAEIQAGIKSGQLVCDPFDPELLNPNSIDLRLGGWFYLGERVGHRVDFSPYDEEEVKTYYHGPLQAVTHAEWCEEHQRHPFKGIDLDEYIIVLAPGECILAHTVEFVGARYGATTMMKARSSLGRINISSCDDAGSGDVGYFEPWTMEMRNKNEHVWVPLVCGMPVAQLLFFWVLGAKLGYTDTGHYQGSSDLEIMKTTWNPEKMLPRLFSEKNRRIRQKTSKNPDVLFMGYQP